VIRISKLDTSTTVTSPWGALEHLLLVRTPLFVLVDTSLDCLRESVGSEGWAAARQASFLQSLHLPSRNYPKTERDNYFQAGRRFRLLSEPVSGLPFGRSSTHSPRAILLNLALKVAPWEQIAHKQFLGRPVLILICLIISLFRLLVTQIVPSAAVHCVNANIRQPPYSSQPSRTLAQSFKARL